MGYQKQRPLSSYSYLRDNQEYYSNPAPTTRDAPPNYLSNQIPTYLPNRYSRPPPPYPEYIRPASSRSRWLPQNWSKRKRIGVAIATVALILIIIIAAVVATKDNNNSNGSDDSNDGEPSPPPNSYPDYSPLHYRMVDTFAGSTFFDGFDFFVAYDPANGFVNYTDTDASFQMGLTHANKNSAILRVDNNTSPAYNGRNSVRIYSKKTYNDGLFIFDVLHTPYGCASWPAVWLNDQANWPTNGEIDVIESVNRGIRGNQMALHTSKGCTMAGVKREQTGNTLQANCYNATNNNAGCTVRGPDASFGAAANERHGGVYAMELRAAGIRMWFFPRADVPQDITDAVSPQPENWGTALADFPNTTCDIEEHFRNLSITVDIDVCGQWAGREAVYSGENNCGNNCTQLAIWHPEAFDQAYWEFKAFRVYQAKGSSST